MRFWPLAVFPLVALLHSTSALAQPLSDFEVSRRLAFVETRLANGTAKANLWWNSAYYGWMALTTGQFVFALATSNEGTRKDMAVGAAASTLALIPLGVLPFPARTAWRDLSRVSGGSSAEKRRKPVFAEHLLESAAKDEKLRRSWVNHATSIGVSIGVGVLLGVGYDRPMSGLLNALGGIALSEIQIWSTPTAAIGDWAEYQKFRHVVSTGLVAPSPGPYRATNSAVTISILPRPGGLSITGSFW